MEDINIINYFLDILTLQCKLKSDIQFEKYNLMISQIKEIEKSSIAIIEVQDFLITLKNSKFYLELINSIKNLKTNYIYKSDIHGLSHSIKVLMYGIYICIEEGLSFEEIKLMINAFLYHDIGRINDKEDKMHGTRSAEMISGVLKELDNDSISLLKVLLTYHSLNDIKETRQFNIANYSDERVIFLINILKDADALDRVRIIEPWGLDIRYLRTKSAKKLVKMAYLIHYNYLRFMEE